MKTDRPEVVTLAGIQKVSRERIQRWSLPEGQVPFPAPPEAYVPVMRLRGSETYSMRPDPGSGMVSTPFIPGTSGDKINNKGGQATFLDIAKFGDKRLNPSAHIYLNSLKPKVAAEGPTAQKGKKEPSLDEVFTAFLKENAKKKGIKLLGGAFQQILADGKIDPADLVGSLKKAFAPWNIAGEFGTSLLINKVFGEMWTVQDDDALEHQLLHKFAKDSVSKVAGNFASAMGDKISDLVFGAPPKPPIEFGPPGLFAAVLGDPDMAPTGNTISTGSQDVFIGTQKAARVSDLMTPSNKPIIEGSPNVNINGLPAAYLSNATAVPSKLNPPDRKVFIGTGLKSAPIQGAAKVAGSAAASAPSGKATPSDSDIYEFLSDIGLIALLKLPGKIDENLAFLQENLGIDGHSSLFWGLLRTNMGGELDHEGNLISAKNADCLWGMISIGPLATSAGCGGGPFPHEWGILGLPPDGLLWGTTSFLESCERHDIVSKLPGDPTILAGPDGEFSIWSSFTVLAWQAEMLNNIRNDAGLLFGAVYATAVGSAASGAYLYWLGNYIASGGTLELKPPASKSQ